MNIKVKHRYKGPLTGNIAIQPGDYNANDLPPGLAEYLVENDHAVVIGSNIARAIDVVQAASTEVKGQIFRMLSRELSQDDEPELPVVALYRIPNGELTVEVISEVTLDDIASDVTAIEPGANKKEPEEEPTEDKPKKTGRKKT